MHNHKSFCAALAVASAALALSAPAHAQATRTWVSGVGSDINPCSRTAPCRTFAGAIGQTATNGIINCIDNGGYGSVTITKSITIDCHETLASILASKDGVKGIVIDIPAGDPKDPRVVRLRNLDISGVGAGLTGIDIISAAAVELEDMAVTGFTKQAINDVRSDGNTMLTIRNSVVANNGSAGIAAAASKNTLVLDNVQSVRNGYGLALAKTNTATISRSVFANNSAAGVEVDPGGQLMLDSSMVSFNGTGIEANGGAVGLTNSDVAFNNTAITGASTSFGNNRIFGNAAVGVAPSAAGGASTDLGQQ